MTTAPVPRFADPVPVPPVERRVSRRVAQLAGPAASGDATDAVGPVVDLASGRPDVPTQPHVLAAAAAAVQDPVYRQPAPPGGLAALQEAVVAAALRDSGLSARPADVLVTAGVTQAVAEALATLLDDGDEVLLPAPHQAGLPDAVRLAGGVPVPVLADEASGYLVSVGQLEAARTAHTRLLVFSSPSDPTGAVVPADEVAEIGRWAQAAGLWVLADESRADLTYGPGAPSLPSLVPELQPHCVVVGGVGALHGMAGWPVGWLLGPADVVAAATALQAHSGGPVSTVSQVAACAALDGDRSGVAAARAAFDRRRRTALELLRTIPGIACPEPLGGHHLFPSVRALLGRPIAGRSVATSRELARLLLTEARVAVVPGEEFGAPGYLRISYAVGDAELTEGLGRLQRLLATAG